MNRNDPKIWVHGCSVMIPKEMDKLSTRTSKLPSAFTERDEHVTDTKEGVKVMHVDRKSGLIMVRRIGDSRIWVEVRGVNGILDGMGPH